MKLTILTPLSTVVKAAINKVTVETLAGYYTLLPKHVDFAAAMNANIVCYTNVQNEVKYVACHRGIVVKKGDEVTISTQDAVEGATLDELQTVIEHTFKQDEEQRKELNSAMARLELGILRGFGKLYQENYDGGI